MIKLALRLCLCSFLLVPVIWAQVGNGEITGTVSDSTGAVMPGVQVEVRNVATGVRFAPVTTDERGVYSILNLPVGSYALHFAKEGFTSYERSSISISVGQVLKLDVSMQVGATAESVSVRADASALDTQTATVATTMNASALSELPMSVNGSRDVSRFAYTTVPTVNGTHAYDSQVAGSLTVSKVMMIDGTDADAGIQGTQPTPGMDAVLQFQVATSGIGAESAGTGGGAFVYVLKSGTNDFHGSAFGFLANEALNANTWDNNFWGAFCANAANAANGNCGYSHARPRNRFNDFGFSAGGPVWFPKLYNGKNKTFIFVNFERYNASDLRFLQNSTTTPTTAMLQGDFSALLDTSTVLGRDAAGNPVYKGAIFDPQTGSVFPGNIIPPNRISMQSQKIAALYKKYYPPNNNSVVNNFNSPLAGDPLYKQYNLDLKLDHNFSDKNHFSVSYDYFNQPVIGLGDNSGALWVNGSSDPGPLNASQQQTSITRNIRGIDTYTFSPHVVNTFSVAYNEWWKGEYDPSFVDNQALGFTATDGVMKNNFPVINFSGANGINETSIGNRFGYNFLFSQWHFKDTLSWLKGRHQVKFGGEFTAFASSDTGTAGGLTYNFSNLTGAPLSLAQDPQVNPYIGFGFANFLLGYVDTASKVTGIPLSGHRKGMNFFVEDEIKVTPRFTLNASLRWDITLPWHEDNGHWSEFDLDASSPVWAPYQGAYQFLKNGSQTFETNNNFHQFGPHLGAAYQVSSKLVARAAWGMFYVPLGINQWGALPFQSESIFGYVGSNAVGHTAPTAPAFNWDQNIYPGNPVAPVADPNNPLMQWGSPYIDANSLQLGRTQNWNVGVQYEISKDTVIDVNYIGNIGRKLHAGNLDPRNYPTWSSYSPLLMSGHVGDTIYTEADAQKAGVPWLPFGPTEQFVGWSQGYYPAYAALFPYPQVAAGTGVVTFAGSPIGSSSYKAMVVEVKKRGGDGLVADLSYTLSRASGNVDNSPFSGGNMAENWVLYSAFQDPYSYGAFAGMVSPSDMTHQVKGYLMYDLPFGHGKKLASRAGRGLNLLIGGWTLGTLVSYHSGMPLNAVASSFGYPGYAHLYANVNTSQLGNHFKTLDLANINDPSNRYYSASAFTDPVFGSLGNQSPYYPEFRGFGYSNEDLSIVKHFGFGRDGHYRVTLRGEFFNVFNRHHWNNPNGGATNSPTLGLVTGVSGNRSGQVGCRFEW